MADIWDEIGGALGAAGGFFLGGPAGAVAGYAVGSGLGGMLNSDEQDELNKRTDAMNRQAAESLERSKQIAADYVKAGSMATREALARSLEAQQKMFPGQIAPMQPYSNAGHRALSALEDYTYNLPDYTIPPSLRAKMTGQPLQSLDEMVLSDLSQFAPAPGQAIMDAQNPTLPKGWETYKPATQTVEDNYKEIIAPRIAAEEERRRQEEEQLEAAREKLRNWRWGGKAPPGTPEATAKNMQGTGGYTTRSGSGADAKTTVTPQVRHPGWGNTASKNTEDARKKKGGW